jgi:hypothetical protein
MFPSLPLLEHDMEIPEDRWDIHSIILTLKRTFVSERNLYVHLAHSGVCENINLFT